MKLRWLIVMLFGAAVLQAGPLARFKVSSRLGGTIDVELFDDKPATVSNFVAYVKAGLWHASVPHRLAPGFVLQGGSFSRPAVPSLLEPIPLNANNQLIDNRIPVPAFPPIPFEAHLGRRFSNRFGTIAMARVGTDTNSASSNWFFNLNDNTNLDGQDGGYTVFGKTLRGTNTLNAFKFAGGAERIPVFDDAGVSKWVQFDISVLTAQIAPVPAGFEIAWESVEGLENIVEYTTAFPAGWQTVRTVTGTGERMTVVDNPGTDPSRVYRVRVVFPN